jgi:hypothetical protein
MEGEMDHETELAIARMDAAAWEAIAMDAYALARRLIEEEEEEMNCLKHLPAPGSCVSATGSSWRLPCAGGVEPSGSRPCAEALRGGSTLPESLRPPERLLWCKREIEVTEVNRIWIYDELACGVVWATGWDRPDLPRCLFQVCRHARRLT